MNAVSVCHGNCYNYHGVNQCTPRGRPSRRVSGLNGISGGYKLTIVCYWYNWWYFVITPSHHTQLLMYFTILYD